MAVPTFVASDWAEGVINGTTVDVPYPAGIVAGDMLVAHINLSAGTPQSYPAGWTHFSGSPAVAGSGGTEQNTVWQYKIATGSESGTEQWTRTSVFGRPSGAISAWRDVMSSVEDSDVYAANAMIPITTGTVSASDDGRLVLLWAMTGAHGSSAMSPPSGWTEEYDHFRSGEHHIEMSHWPVASAGTQGPFTMVSDTGPAGPYNQTALLIAFASAPAFPGQSVDVLDDTNESATRASVNAQYVDVLNDTNESATRASVNAQYVDVLNDTNESATRASINAQSVDLDPGEAAPPEPEAPDAIAELQSVAVLSRDTLLVTFAEPMVVNASLSDVASYTVTADDAGIAVTVKEVLLKNADASTSQVLIVITSPTVDEQYTLEVSGDLLTTSWTTIDPAANSTPFVARNTKMDRVLSSMPLIYSHQHASRLRLVLHALAREDDTIGGNRNDYLE